MMQDYGANHQLYQERLSQIGSILNQLATVSQVIWLNQNPVGELYGKTGAKNTDIHTQKIYQYNNIVHHTFKLVIYIQKW